MPPCVQITDLTKCYGRVVALGGLTLSAEQGEILGLLGPNGAGKSTTLSLLTGLARPTSGSVALFGKDLRKHFIEVIGRVGVVVERPAFHDYLTARQNLAISARLAGKQVNNDRLLDRVGLLSAGSRAVKTYSQGMRQRLALAQALLGEPDLLILDETTNGLDAESSHEVLRFLRQTAREGGVTILFASHRLQEVESLCDRVAILNRGRLVSCESTEKLLSYDSKQVDILTDASEAAARRLRGEPWVEDASAALGRVSVTLGSGTIHQLTVFLVQAGYQISGVIPQRRTLQDFFLEVVQP
jgi:ABC-2 type transport system ATP-binding protein